MEIPYKGQVISDEFDLTNPMFREEWQNFLSEIKINNSEATDVEERTRGQSSNPEWFTGKYRTGRITASSIKVYSEQGQSQRFSVLKDSDLHQ